MTDLIDDILQLQPGDAVWEVRRTRPEVLESLQAAYEAIHAPSADAPSTGITADERAAVAYRVAAAAGQPALAAHYAGLIGDEGIRAAAVEDGDASERVATILDWASLVAERPQASGADEVAELKAAGLDDPQIVTLAQIIGFTAFQARVVVGLDMMGI
jgi:uncharacterized protein YciW